MGSGGGCDPGGEKARHRTTLRGGLSSSALTASATSRAIGGRARRALCAATTRTARTASATVRVGDGSTFRATYGH